MTVEAALGLFSLVAVLALVLSAAAAAGAQLRCLDAAREAARLVARGEPDRARAVAAEVAPRNASTRIRIAGDQVEVEVAAPAVPGLPGLSLTGRAVGLLEPAALTGPTGLPGPVPAAPVDTPPVDAPPDGAAPDGDVDPVAGGELPP